MVLASRRLPSKAVFSPHLHFFFTANLPPDLQFHIGDVTLVNIKFPLHLFRGVGGIGRTSL
jgi:hypothetical protein